MDADDDEDDFLSDNGDADGDIIACLSSPGKRFSDAASTPKTTKHKMPTSKKSFNISNRSNFSNMAAKGGAT